FKQDHAAKKPHQALESNNQQPTTQTTHSNHQTPSKNHPTIKPYNSPPPQENTKMDSRLTELEIKVAFQDDLLDSLNLAVARQQRQIDLLQEQLQALYQQMRSSGTGGTEGGPQHEIPPHY
ncbi:SlyX family protein, partial [Cupriavidus sp. SK-3]|uniref:SlyX family protein n=2 Tax=unclassified Cupriavidus TaxID=2640874 RepID=UPI0039C86F8B